MMKTNNLNIDIQTKSLLEQGGLEEAPSSFTETIMNKLKMSEKPLLASYTPVINKKGWLLISAFMVLLIVVFIITGSMESNQGSVSYGYTKDITNTINSITGSIIHIFTIIPSYILLFPFALILFYGFEKLLKKLSGRQS